MENKSFAEPAVCHIFQIHWHRVTLVCAAFARLVDLSNKRIVLQALTEIEQQRVGMRHTQYYKRFFLLNDTTAPGAIVGPFMYFDPDCCSGRYRLDLGEPYQRLLARTLQGRCLLCECLQRSTKTKTKTKIANVNEQCLTVTQRVATPKMSEQRAWVLLIQVPVVTARESCATSVTTARK